jgi:RNA polymerase sigma-70 factor (ECF subfamily)
MSRSEVESLYDSCAPTLLAFFVRRTGDPHTARDLWAETFAARRRFRGSTSPDAESWLYGIAYRQLAQYHRRGGVCGVWGGSRSKR